MIKVYGMTILMFTKHEIFKFFKKQFKLTKPITQQ